MHKRGVQLAVRRRAKESVMNVLARISPSFDRLVDFPYTPIYVFERKDAGAVLSFSS